MIVTCEQCQTKFKIPDEKVTEKGVRVRCTKCSHTFRVTRPHSVELNRDAPVDSADPFSRFGAPPTVRPEEATRPGVFALGVEASRLPLASPPALVQPAPPRAAAAPFDFSSLTPAVAPKQPSTAPAPFDFTSLVGTAPSVPEVPSAAAVSPVSFDFSSLPVGPSTAAEPAKAPPLPRTSAPARPVEAPAMSFDFSTLSQPQETPAAEPPAVSPAVASLLGDLPPPKEVLPPTFGDEFFAPSADQSAQPLSAVPSSASTEEARDVLFDMSAVGTIDPVAPVAPADPAPSTIVEAPVSSPSAVIVVPRPPDPATEGRRRVLGMVVNAVIAVVLVGGLVVAGTAAVNEGKLDVQSIESSLKGLLASPSPMTTEDISNGLYDTKMGRPVFFVRGIVTNRTQSASRVRVKAEILDGATLVRTAEVVAGATPSAEELHGLSEVSELKAMVDRTAGRAPAIGAGESAPFLVTFAEYPPDLQAFRVRVTAVPDTRPTTSAVP